MPTKIRYQKITPKDLTSPHAFKLWIQNNLEHLYVGKNIINEHLLIYLDYVEQVIRKSNQIDRPFWMEIIRKLNADLKSIKKVEE